jgi:hypothetical protein
LGDGAAGEVTLEPQEDKSALMTEGGMLALDVSESQPTITIDGQARGVYAAPLRLARGVHRLLVERGDFEPVEQEVNVAQGGTTRVSIVLDPTPEHRAKYVSSAQAHKTWGWISIAAGAAVIGGSITYTIINNGIVSDAQAQDDAIVAARANNQSPCNLPGGDNPEVCGALISDADSRLSSAKTRRLVAYGGMGIGAGIVALGVVLLATGDDVHRYDRQSSTDLGKAKPNVVPYFAPLIGGGALGLGGVF